MNLVAGLAITHLRRAKMTMDSVTYLTSPQPPKIQMKEDARRGWKVTLDRKQDVIGKEDFMNELSIKRFLISVFGSRETVFFSFIHPPPPPPAYPPFTLQES